MQNGVRDLGRVPSLLVKSSAKWYLGLNFAQTGELNFYPRLVTFSRNQSKNSTGFQNPSKIVAIPVDFWNPSKIVVIALDFRGSGTRLRPRGRKKVSKLRFFPEFSPLQINLGTILA